LHFFFLLICSVSTSDESADLLIAEREALRLQRLQLEEERRAFTESTLKIGQERAQLQVGGILFIHFSFFFFNE